MILYVMRKRSYVKKISIIFLFIMCINNHVVQSQETIRSQIRRIDPKDREIHEKDDKYKPKPLTQPSLTVPETEPLQEGDILSGKILVFVNKFILTGNTVFSEDDISAITSPYENKKITFEELQALRQELTLLYINNGYINSGVIIPDQQVIDGVIVLRAVEGELSDMKIEGNKYFRTNYIMRRIEISSRPPLNINSLRDTLQVLQQDSRIKRINAELEPGIKPGEAVLKVNVEEENPYHVTMNFNNNESPSVGSYRGELVLAHDNVSGIGDILRAELGLTEGAEDYYFSYSIPLNAYDTTAAVYYEETDSTVIEEDFEQLDIESKTESYGISISHPVYKTISREFSLSFTGEIRRNETFLLGRPFSFTEVADNVTHLTALRFLQEWVSRGEMEVLAVRSSFSLGIDAFNATKSDTGADGEFFLWLGQFLWIKQWTDNEVQTVFHTDVQLANDSLLPMEKFTVGGMYSVRGYRENQLVRDNGVVSSLELRLPVIRNRQREVIVQFAPFIDLGWSWNARRETPDPKSISSIGAGIRWAIRENMHFNLYAGHALRNIDNLDHDLQDEGIHFQLSWNLL